MTLISTELPLAVRPLQGRTALVTGAATGIGAATARALAAAGATVAIAHLDQIDLARGVLDAVRRSGADGIEISADLTDPDAAAMMASQIRNELGPVDILVNNAGAYPRTTWANTDEAAWAAAPEINLSAHYRACRAVTPSMTARGWGRIVNVSSVNARAGRPGLVAYGAAKAGLLGLAAFLARELGPHGITVNTVVPGAIQVDTENTLPPRQARGPDRPAVRPPPGPGAGRRRRDRLPQQSRRILHQRPVVAHRRRPDAPLTATDHHQGEHP